MLDTVTLIGDTALAIAATVGVWIISIALLIVFIILLLALVWFFVIKPLAFIAGLTSGLMTAREARRGREKRD